MTEKEKSANSPKTQEKSLDEYEPQAYTEVGEYKGNPIITIHGGMRPFGFGLRKAELIVEVIDDIKKFIEEERQKRGEQG